MTYYWSPTTKSFYPEIIKGIYQAANSWPSDAVTVSDDVFAEFGTATPPVGKRRGVVNGAPAWVDVTVSTPDTPALTLADQAETALAAARTYVINTYTMLNEATPDAWVTYLKALMAIANGTDTTSTELPTSPAS